MESPENKTRNKQSRLARQKLAFFVYQLGSSSLLTRPKLPQASHQTELQQEERTDSGGRQEWLGTSFSSRNRANRPRDVVFVTCQSPIAKTTTFIPRNCRHSIPPTVNKRAPQCSLHRPRRTVRLPTMVWTPQLATCPQRTGAQDTRTVVQNV